MNPLPSTSFSHTVGSYNEEHDEALLLARNRVQITFGSVDFKERLDLNDKTIIKVDDAFQTMKRTIFDRLVAKRSIEGVDFENFKMDFNHNRQIARWWISNASIKGEYDHYGDCELTSDQRDKIVNAHKQIVVAASPVINVDISQMHKVIPGCLGSMSKSNLSRYFDKYDHDLFAGGLAKQKGTEAQKREQAFADYMENEFLKVTGKLGVRSPKEVSKDIGSVLIYHNEMIKAIDARYEALKSQLEAAKKSSPGIETNEMRTLLDKMQKLGGLKASIDNMHMSPMFVSKTYEVPVDSSGDSSGQTIYQRFSTLKERFQEHYRLFDKQRSRAEGLQRFFKREGNPDPKRFEELAFLMASKALFTGDRPSFVQHCYLHKRTEQQTFGPEEYIFDRLLDQKLSRKYESLPVFESLDEGLKKDLNTALSKAKDDKVSRFRARLERYHISSAAHTAEETIAYARKQLLDLLS